MRCRGARGRPTVALVVAVAACLFTAASAFGHARVLPAEALAGGTLFALSVPNEKETARTNKVVLTVPEGFNVGLFSANPGWTREVETTGSGEETTVAKVTWTAEGEGTDEGGLFEFTGRGDPGSYTFQVAQSYSDGSVVNWSGPEDADEPAPVVELKDSFASGGGGTTWVAWAALAVGVIALVVGGIAVARQSGRQLA
jgi:uncharacterized protein YcnI